MTNIKKVAVLIVLIVSSSVVFSQQSDAFEDALIDIKIKLDSSVYELNDLREQIANEKVPLSRKLSDMEAQLTDIRAKYQQTTRLLDSRTLDLNNLRSKIKSKKDQISYLSNLLSEYTRNFESRLHIAEIQRYKDQLDKVKLAMENTSISEEQLYKIQNTIVSLSIDRLYDLLNGTQFKGTAVDVDGVVKDGTFVLIGPTAIFQSNDREVVGAVEQRLGSLEPSVVSFGNESDSLAASELVNNQTGKLPFDATLGSAHKIEETKETLLDHIQKGGVVMYPILGMAGLALLVAICKLIYIIVTAPKPSQRHLQKLLTSIADHNESKIKENVIKIKGPIGKMLKSGVEHINEPRELIEEVMYEKVLSTRLKLESFLPFIAISAASAPLLGLLGTVTGIINTFKLITVFGSGDVKTLSGGISEALITTEFGLIVAIPSLLLHAFLSRKAKGAVNEMEKAAVAFINQVSKKPFHRENKNNASGGITAEQMQEIIKGIGSQSNLAQSSKYSREYAGGMMRTNLISIDRNATVADAIYQIRSTDGVENIDTVFVVDEGGKYAGLVNIKNLLTRPEQTPLVMIAENDCPMVHVDTHQNEVDAIFQQKNNIADIPVLDEENRLVGQISRNQNGNR